MPSVISPSSNNLIVGSGVVYFDPWVGGVPTGEASLGNATKFTLQLQDDVKEIYSSMSSTRELLARAPVKRTATFKMTGTEFSLLNHTLLSAGTIQKYTQVAGTVTGEILGATLGGRYYATKFRNISATTVHVNGTAAVLGTDYSLDTSTNSRIYAIPGGLLDGATAVTIDYSYAATTFNEMAAGSLSGLIEGRIRYVPQNVTGPQQEYEIWHVQVSPEGEMGIITDDFGNWSISGAVLADRVSHPTQPWYVIRDL